MIVQGIAKLELGEISSSNEYDDTPDVVHYWFNWEVVVLTRKLLTENESFWSIKIFKGVDFESECENDLTLAGAYIEVWDSAIEFGFHSVLEGTDYTIDVAEEELVGKYFEFSLAQNNANVIGE